MKTGIVFKYIDGRDNATVGYHTSKLCQIGTIDNAKVYQPTDMVRLTRTIRENLNAVKRNGIIDKAFPESLVSIRIVAVPVYYQKIGETVYDVFGRPQNANDALYRIREYGST